MLVQGLQNVLTLSENILCFSATQRPEWRGGAGTNEDDFWSKRSDLTLVMSDVSIHAGQLAEVASVVENAVSHFL